MERIFQGKGIGSGIAFGRVFLHGRREYKLIRKQTLDLEGELLRFSRAIKIAKEELHKLYERTKEEVNEETATIFQAYLSLLEDPEFVDGIEKRITILGMNAEYAVKETTEDILKMLSTMEDEYLKARSSDIEELSHRLLDILLREEHGEDNLQKAYEMSEAIKEHKIQELQKSMEEIILVAKDLTPGEFMSMKEGKITGIVLEEGSEYSHMAIIAKSKGMPLIIQANLPMSSKIEGKSLIIDAKSGNIYLDPNEETIGNYRNKKKQEEILISRLSQYKGKKDITLSGQEVKIYANAGSLEDVRLAKDADAAGIGLFRTEYIFLNRKDYPGEEEQLALYQEIVREMQGRKVVFRTIDIGADKQANCFHLEEEANPALGYRGIRICLDQVDLFKGQLRALYRASAMGNLSIMVPMIISLEEVRKVKEIILRVKEELRKEGHSYGRVEFGIMIETPAAVFISDLLAEEVDFFSIGSNDLIQFTMAADRLNKKLDYIYKEKHEAILRMLAMVVENAHKKGIPVSLCGELAGDDLWIEDLMRLGIDELSVSPGQVLSIRKRIREMKLS